MVFDNQSAVTQQQQMTWLQSNTAWCQRMQAFLSVDACLDNQLLSKQDCRCDHCNDLFNQAPPECPAETLSVLELPHDAVPPETTAPLDAEDDELPLPDDFDEILADWDDQVMADVSVTEQKYEESPKLIMNFCGRCPVCNGYMQPVYEAGDWNVFRCVNCGFRTSPGYERNRMYHAKTIGKQP